MDQPIRRGRATVRGMPTEAFIVEYSRGRTLLMTVLSATLALVGLLLLLVGDGDGRFWGGVCLLFFGAGTVALGTQVRRPGRLALTPGGLYGESRFAHAFAPWDSIAGVGRSHISRSEMITVDVTDASRLETSGGIAWLKGLNQSMGMPDLAFPTSLLGSRAGALEKAIAHYVAHPEARPRIGSEAELRRLLAEIGQPAIPAGDTPRSEGMRPAAPTAAHVILWLAGGLGLLLTAAAALGEPDPGREGSRLIGLLIFGTSSVAALGSAWLLTRRPSVARPLGLLAAAGGLFIGWAVTQNAGGLPGALIGLGVGGAALLVGWQLARWSPAPVRPA